MTQSATDHRKVSYAQRPEAVTAFNRAMECLRTGKQKQAESTLRHLTSIVPDYPEPWHQLGLMALMQADYLQAEHNVRTALKLEPRSPVYCNTLGLTLQHQNRLNEAINCFCTALQIQPGIADLYLNIGLAYTELNQFPQAIAHFEKAVLIKPDYTSAYHNMAVAHQLQNNPDAALAAFKNVLRCDPSNLEAHINIGNHYFHKRQYDNALQYYEEATAIEPADPRPFTNLGLIHMQTGRLETAAEFFRKAIEKDPEAVFPYIYLITCRKIGENDPLFRILEEKLPHAGTNEKIAIHFTLGTMYNSVNQYDSAFENYAKGNQVEAAAADAPYNFSIISHHVEEVIQTFSPSVFASLPRASVSTPRPIFIVGMPRSGTTLVEQIISSHPSVYGAGELPFIERIRTAIYQKARQPDAAAVIELLTPEILDNLAGQYRDIVKPQSGDASCFTDKMPQNFINLWLIALLFPEARIVHCQRNAKDTCISLYAQHFNGQHGYKHDLETLGAYYLLYKKVMKHWKQALPLPILDIRYEALINHQKKYTRRLLEFLGLDWSEQCMRFHENDRIVKTASRFKVKSEIYSSSIGRWRNYAPHLEPLRNILQSGVGRH